MKTALLIDDELNSLDTLEYELKHFAKDIKVIGTCSDPRTAKPLIESLKPEVLFLDIEMPWISGFELLDSLDKIDFQLVFVTAYDQFAIKAFEYFTLDYLLKPVSRSALERAISKITKAAEGKPGFEVSYIIDTIRQQQKEVKKIALPVKNGYEFYKHVDIVRCEADANYSKVFVKNEKPILVSKSLKVISAMLDYPNFFRPHQSHLINLDYMKKFDKSDGGTILMEDGTNVPLSRHKKMAFMELVKKLGTS
ncbi:MAG: LytTR family transcriptional regulator DNA-binding domain-containing protein [Bacteroidota bacterium]